MILSVSIKHDNLEQRAEREREREHNHNDILKCSISTAILL